MAMSFTKRFGTSILGSAFYLALAIIGEGGIASFFSHPALITLTVMFAFIAVLALFAGGNVSPGVREDRSNRWVLIPFSVLPLAAGFFAPYTDRIGFWTVDGESIRWIGVLMGGVGSALRIAPVYVLGDRFSGLVAIQSGHTLVTTGLYSKIRNPSYLGLLLGSVGWALAFRSGVGLILTALLIPPLVARMNSEERLLHSQFGAEYQAYRSRTSRLIPHVY